MYVHATIRLKFTNITYTLLPLFTCAYIEYWYMYTYALPGNYDRCMDMSTTHLHLLYTHNTYQQALVYMYVNHSVSTQTLEW